nr:dihydrofolate reductase [Quercus suber]
MLHGYTQSGPLFSIKTKALQKSLDKHFPPAPKPGHLPAYPGGLELVFPTAPIELSTTDIPGYDVDGSSKSSNALKQEALDAYGWWRRKGDAEPYTYEGLERGLAAIADVLQDAVQQGRPFDGALGFSQGGAAAGMLASLLEPGRREAFEALQAHGGMRFPDSFTRDSGFIEEMVAPPLKFAVSYSGFAASTHELYRAFYEPRIRTPMLHFLGSVDTVVEEARSLRLVEACEGGRGVEGGVSRVVYHPGGHFLPSSQKQYVAALVAFIREIVGQDGKAEEEDVGDMDVPF